MPRHSIFSYIGYTLYTTLSWWLFNPRHELSDLDLFFRVGADTANYYEIRYRFDESSTKRINWKQMQINLAELSNTKNEPADSATGWIDSRVTDPKTGQVYRVRVVGRPDLRRIKRYYFGVINDVRQHIADLTELGLANVTAVKDQAKVVVTDVERHVARAGELDLVGVEGCCFEVSRQGRSARHAARRA